MTASMTTITNCPSDETLAAFIDGRLEGEARETVLAHVATCSECRDMLNSVHELEALTPARRSWLIPAATLAAAAAIAAVVFLGPAGQRYMRTRNLEALSAATEKLSARPIAARPSIGIAYKQHVVLRSGNEPEIEGMGDLLDETLKLTTAAEKNPTAENLHAAGIAWLLAEDYDAEAVRNLEEAAKAATPSANLLNDLAAAYHEANDEVKAKAAIEKAWQMDNKSPHIAWTRAVILDTREAWNDYLKIDSTSEWAKEAREKLDLL